MRYLVSGILILVFPLILKSQCPTDSYLYLDQLDIDRFGMDYPNCTEIEGTLFIHDGSNPVTDLSGLSQLRGVTESLIIRGTKHLKTLDGLDNILFIGGNLQIESNDSLQALYAFNSTDMKSVQGDIWISSNPLLTTLEAFDHLEKIYSEGEFAFSGLYFWDNPSLLNVNELSNLNFVAKGVYFYGCDNLESLYGLRNLTEIPEDLIISHSMKLNSLDGLDDLKSIGGNLSLSYTAIQDLDELNALTSIGGALILGFNDNLLSIMGLENVDPESLQGDREGNREHVNIFFNPLLKQCAINSICQILQRNDVSHDIEYNGEGCSSYDELIENCNAVSVEESVLAPMRMYPNPVQDILTLESDKSSTALIMDNRGHTLKGFSLSPGRNRLDLSDLGSGSYIIMDFDGNRHLLIKI